MHCLTLCIEIVSISNSVFQKWAAPMELVWLLLNRPLHTVSVRWSDMILEKNNSMVPKIVYFALGRRAAYLCIAKVSAAFVSLVEVTRI